MAITGSGALTANAIYRRPNGQQDISGTYRCWSFNSGNIGGRCTSPPIVLNKNGTYQISSERGAWKLKGNQLTLSKSAMRGSGTMSADGLQIHFSYKYKGIPQTVTYLRQNSSTAAGAGASVLLDLTIHYATPDSSLDYINVIQLIAKDDSSKTIHEAIAYDPDRQTLKSYFKKGVPGGQIYRVITSSGSERREVGILDLRSAKGETARTLETKAAVDNPVVTE